ncbi:MAG: hypothetical protein JJU36_08235 [Phycisphaeraceae bacterium]|nr:hypothetical protein [Phycisphaeraceae bacterium]
MELWLASSDLRQIERMMGLGIFAGVITNPRVVAQADRRPEDLFKALCELAPAAWYQLRDADLNTMTAEAQRMLAIDPAKMRIKVPATLAGFGVVSRLAAQGLDVMATCVPTAAWLCFALAAGATRIAPYGGMLQKRGLTSKRGEVIQMQQIIDRQAPDVTICTGVYDVTELPEYATAGVKSFFVWGKDVDTFLDQPLVGEALAEFGGDWQKIAER